MARPVPVGLGLRTVNYYPAEAYLAVSLKIMKCDDRFTQGLLPHIE
jgi:hypothetical protein